MNGNGTQPFAAERSTMVERQLRQRGIRDERLLAGPVGGHDADVDDVVVERERVGQAVRRDRAALREERLELAAVVELHERLVHVVEEGLRDGGAALLGDVE